jgi:hypothetical protein
LDRRTAKCFSVGMQNIGQEHSRKCRGKQKNSGKEDSRILTRRIVEYLKC